MFALFLYALLLHPVHETVTEVEWNAENGRVEVAVRLHVLDEQWIRRQHDREADAEHVAIAYMKRHVRLDVDAETATPTGDQYHWVGREEDGSHVWWYCEIELASRQEPHSLRQTMLFEHAKGHVNRVIYLSRQPKLAQSLTLAKPVMDLTAAVENSALAK